VTVAVAGLWHIGMVPAACLARCSHDVVFGFAEPAITEQLKQNIMGSADLRLRCFAVGCDDLLKRQAGPGERA